MKVTVDLSGLDSFIQEVEDEINQGLIDAAHKAVDTQKVRNESGKKTYENHTCCLLYTSPSPRDM